MTVVDGGWYPHHHSRQTQDEREGGEKVGRKLLDCAEWERQYEGRGLRGSATMSSLRGPEKS